MQRVFAQFHIGHGARGWLLVLPALLIFLIFYVGPAVIGLQVSLFKWDGVSTSMEFVALSNYQRLLHEPRFWNAVGVNLALLVASLMVLLPSALVIAIALSRRGVVMGFFRTVIFLPQVLSVATIALVWTLVYDPYQGLLNHLLGLLGFNGQPWLGERLLALISVFLVIAWSSLGFHGVLFLAGLSGIPPEFYDAASLETSSRLEVLRYITIPLLRETIFIAFVVIVGSSFGHATGLVYLLTFGGPQNATEMLGLYSYSMAFRARDFGYASAISFLVLVLVLALMDPGAADRAGAFGVLGMEISQRAAEQPITLGVQRSGMVSFLRYVGLGALTLSILTPLIWVFLLSFKDRRDFSSSPFGLPTEWRLDNYTRLFNDPRMGIFTVNSIVVSLVSVAIVVVASTLAGYALARMQFPGQRFLFTLFLIGDTIPLFVVLIPLFIFTQSIGLSGSRWSLILPYAAMNMGLAVFMMRGFMRSISTDIEDAARVDGCSTWQLIAYILLPLVRPGALVVAIVTFIVYWNEYFLVQVLMPTQELFTLPAGMASLFMGRFGSNWPIWGAGITLSVIPVIVLFALAQDKIVKGWTFSQK